MLSSLLSRAVSILIRTLRIRFEGEGIPERAVVTFWHSRMLVGWWVSRANAVAMVSKSKDGEYLSAILARWKYILVRGSSGKGGIHALEEAIVSMQQGKASRLVMTPDGPQGPPEIFKRGAFIAAQRLDLPVCFLEIEHHTKKVFHKSWDKFQVPLPFSTVLISVRMIDASHFPESQEAQNIFLQEISSSLQIPTPQDAH